MLTRVCLILRIVKKMQFSDKTNLKAEIMSLICLINP
jgi:hypothetical protein